MAKLWNSNQLAEFEFPDPAYLVEPVIPQGGIVLLHGKPGVGKTQLILTLAHSINTGTPFLDRWPTRQGKVVVVQADMTGPIQQDRLLKVCNDVDLTDTYWVVEEDGSTPYLNIETMTVLEQELVEAIKEADPVLIVWDTLRKIHHLPENASESAIAVYHSARKIHPSATHLFVHHDRKRSRDPDASQEEDEAFMGNQQWKGAADATASLEALNLTSVPKRLSLHFHKARTASDLERRPVLLELDMNTVLLYPVG